MNNQILKYPYLLRRKFIVARNITEKMGKFSAVINLFFSFLALNVGQIVKAELFGYRIAIGFYRFGIGLLFDEIFEG